MSQTNKTWWQAGGTARAISAPRLIVPFLFLSVGADESFSKPNREGLIYGSQRSNWWARKDSVGENITNNRRYFSLLGNYGNEWAENRLIVPPSARQQQASTRCPLHMREAIKTTVNSHCTMIENCTNYWIHWLADIMIWRNSNKLHCFWAWLLTANGSSWAVKYPLE